MTSTSTPRLAVDEPPRLVFIGCTGGGKSSLCSALTGQTRQTSSFAIGTGSKSETTECEVAAPPHNSDPQELFLGPRKYLLL